MSEEKKEKSVVILHQFPRLKHMPSPSPYPLKVETFLRMHKIPYESEFKNFMGPKGKCPWITDDDGTVIADSQFIIEHLTKKHNIVTLELSPEDAAVARSMRALIEDNLYFVAITENTIFGSLENLVKFYPRFVPASAPNFLQKMVIRRIKKKLAGQARAQGIGRHNREEVREIAFSDLEAISNWMGSKPYMMGESPCALDCTAFAFLTVLFHNYPEDFYIRKETETRFPNLKDYVERMKAAYWPDWDEVSS